MNYLARFLPGVMAAGILSLGQASVVLANGGDIHLTEGFVLTPLTIAILGGTIAGFLLAGFLLWAWASRSVKRKEDTKRRLQSASYDTTASGSDDMRQEG